MSEGTALGNFLLRILASEPGREGAKTGGQLALLLRDFGVEVTERMVRRVIAAESALPHWPLVAAVSGHGYFVVRELDDAVKYRDWLLNLAEQAAEKVATFERKARALGLHLPRTRRAGR